MNRKSLLLIPFSITSLFCHSQVTAGSAALYDPNYNSNGQGLSSFYTSKDQDLIVESKGIANHIADTYVATFNLLVEEATMTEVDESSNQRLNALKQDLINHSIPANDIKIELVDLVPSFEVQTETKFLSKNHTEVPKGFICQKTITILFHKSQDLEIIMSKALEHDVYDLVKVDYFLSDLDTKKEELKELCLKDLKKKMSLLKSFTSVTDSAYSIQDKLDVVFPSSRYSSYSAFNSNLSSYSKSKNVSSATKIATTYYNPLEGANYDIIVNPIITEPVIQITYMVGLKYNSTKEPEQDTYYLITPNGQTVRVLK